MKEYEIFIEAVETAVAAGAAIMNIYSGDFDIELKDDMSPLTTADKAAHRIIAAGLEDVIFRGGKIPVISEEAEIPPFAVRKDWPYFWLIDPLDGTKEFINRNGEFTVNIALIEDDHPLLGVVYLPVTGVLYYGGRDCGSYRTAVGDVLLEKAVSLPLTAVKEPGLLRAAGSRSHRNESFNSWVEQEAARRGCSRIEIVTAGSSLKFCLAAEGSVDVYPRFGPTMEWDTAAAHAVAEGAGRHCTSLDGSPLIYNKEKMKNDAFIVR